MAVFSVDVAEEKLRDAVKYLTFAKDAYPRDGELASRFRDLLLATKKELVLLIAARKTADRRRCK